MRAHALSDALELLRAAEARVDELRLIVISTEQRVAKAENETREVEGEKDRIVRSHGLTDAMRSSRHLSAMIIFEFCIRFSRRVVWVAVAMRVAR